MDNILNESFAYDDDVALCGNNFWKTVLYVAGLKIYKDQYPDVARTTRLNAILNYENTYYKEEDMCERGTRDIPILDRGTNNYYTDDDLVGIFNNFFTLYLYNCNKRRDVNFFYKYNLDFDNCNIDQLFLLNSCSLYLNFFKLSLSNLFNFYIDYYENHLTIILHNITTFNLNYYEETVDYSSLEYLNLMM